MFSALVLESDAEIIVSVGEVGFQLQGTAVASDRFGNPAQGAIGLAQVVVIGGGVLQGDRTFNVSDGRLVLARLVSDHAEKVHRIGVVRLGREDLPIDLPGRLQPAGLMVLEGDR